MKDLNYQLGYLAGEYFISNDLPTLSTDELQSRNVIQVDCNLTKQWNERKKSYKISGSDDEFYENLNWYNENIKKRVLFSNIVARIPKVTPTNLKIFGEGFEQALWDCDMSYYKYVEMIPNNERGWCSKIKLTLE